MAEIPELELIYRETPTEEEKQNRSVLSKHEILRLAKITLTTSLLPREVAQNSSQENDTDFSISNVDYKTLSFKQVDAFIKAVESKKVDEVLPLLPDANDLMGSNFWVIDLYCKLMEQDRSYAEFFLEKISIVPSDKIAHFAWIFQPLIQYDLFDTFLEKCQSPISIDRITPQAIQGLYKIVDKKELEKIISLFPNTLTLTDISMDKSNFLGFFCFSENIIDKLPKIIDLQELEYPAIDFLSKIQRTHPNNPFLTKAIVPTAPKDSSIAVYGVLNSMVKSDNPVILSWLHEHFSYTANLKIMKVLEADMHLALLHKSDLFGLSQKEYAQNCINALGTDISISQLSENGADFLTTLLEKAEHNENHPNILDTSCDVYKLSYYQASLLLKLSELRADFNVLDLVPEQIDITLLSSGLHHIIQSKYTDKSDIIQRCKPLSHFPDHLDFYQYKFLIELYLEDPDNDPLHIWECYAKDFSIESVPDISSYFFSQVLQHPKTKERCAQLLEREKKKLRQPITISSIREQKIGTYLFEQIASIRLDLSSKKELRFGWSRYKMHKGGGSTVYVYINLDKSIPRIQFATDIQQDGVDTIPSDTEDNIQKSIQKISEELPEYMVLGNYQNYSNPQQALRSLRMRRTPIRGLNRSLYYRERYAGQTYKDFLRNPEPSINQSLLMQYNFLELSLLLYGINHGHFHERNVNVHFLLTDNKQIQEVYFDAHIALEEAKKRNLEFIPQLCVRDWDLSESI